MTKKWLPVLALALSLIAPMVSAQNTFVLVFLEDAPLRHIKVAIDGKIVGVTDGKGMVQADVEAGPHKLYLIDDDDAIPVRFDMPADGEAEISAVFSRDIEVEPVVKKQIFKQGAIATGYIAGKVTSPSGMPIVNASVKVADLDITTQTNEDGLYTLEVPRGSHIVDVSVEGYTSPEASSIRVFADLGVYAGYKLFKQSLAETIDLPSSSFEEVVTLGVFNPSKGKDMIERYATTIVSAIDADQLARFGDGDVAVALGRIAGLSVTDGKYANVRGLDGRYIAASLNGILMPSTDPMRRDLQLDIFPADIVENIEVQKAFTVDQLASSTGGSIRVNTKGIPEEFIVKAGVSVGYNTDVTGEDVLGYRKSNTEYLGYDNGLRDLNSAVLEATGNGTDLCHEFNEEAPELNACDIPLLASALALSFKPDYDTHYEKADPALGLDFSYGDRKDLFGQEIGYYLSGTYSNSMSARTDAFLNDQTDQVGTYDRSQGNVAISAYGSIGIERDKFDLISKTTFLRSTDNTTRRGEVTIPEEENLPVEPYILEYVQRQLISQIVESTSYFTVGSLDSQLDLRSGYSQSLRIEPDRRRYRLENSILPDSAFERRWSDLDEKSGDFGFDYVGSFDFLSESTGTIKLGALLSEKNRDVSLYRFSLKQQDNRLLISGENGLEAGLTPDLFVTGQVQLNPYTLSTDSYKSIEETQALYLAFNTAISDSMEFEVGSRYEKFFQELTYPNNPFDDSPVVSTAGWYPSLSFTKFLDNDYQLRLGYSKTVSYPGLIERSKSLSYDPQTDKLIEGRSSLISSVINNVDLRLEHYFDDRSSVSVALFAKDIKDPIEKGAMEGAASGITHRNQQSAELYGAEIDFNLDIFERNGNFIFVSGNLTHIDSQVVLGKNSKRLEGESGKNRQLQGQSDLLANLQIGYDHEPSQQSLTLLINYFDDRIYEISGLQGYGPVFEEARALIDLNYEKSFLDNWAFKLKAKNIGNEKVVFYRDAIEIGGYSTGASLSASISYEL